MYARSEKAQHSKAIKVGLSFSRPSLLQIITAHHFFIEKWVKRLKLEVLAEMAVFLQFFFLPLFDEDAIFRWAWGRL